MRTLITLILLSFSIHCSFAETLEDGESVYVFTDKHLDKSLKSVASKFKQTLSSKKVKWKVKKSKSGTWTELAETYEKDLLKNKADRFVIALGLDDLWDNKSDKATEISLDDWRSSVKVVVDALKAAEKKVCICSPFMIYEGTNDVANQRLEAANALLKELAVVEGIVFCDVYSPFAKFIAAAERAKRGKGICTKDGIKLNDKGLELVATSIARALSLAGSTLSRKLRKGDAYILMSSFKNANPMKSLSLSLKEHFGEAMGVESPRAANVLYGVNFIRQTAEKQVEDFKKARATILLIYPDARALGVDATQEYLESGEYKKKLKALLTTARKELDVELFVCTNLIWSEGTDGKTDPAGENYKRCQVWAEQTRAVAKETGVPVLDFHKMCSDYIDEHGLEKVSFASMSKKSSGSIVDYPLTYWGREIVTKWLAELIHFEYAPPKK